MSAKPSRPSAPMRPQRWQRVKDVVAEAIELPPGERAAYLNQACGGDHALRAEVESLLEREAQASDLLSVPDSDQVASLLQAHHAEAAIGRRIGGFEIKAVLGYGGMGIVYEAVQDKPHRTVALKAIRPGVASPSVLKRFDYESQILANLRHPGIAQIYEVGTYEDGTDRIPYFAMELIPSPKCITHYARERKLDLRQRLELFVGVCEAVHHGHQKGIIHRDLKPANILVDSEGRPKIIDFGVARAMDSDVAVTDLTPENGSGPYVRIMQSLDLKRRSNPGRQAQRLDILTTHFRTFQRCKKDRMSCSLNSVRREIALMADADHS